MDAMLAIAVTVALIALGVLFLYSWPLALLAVGVVTALVFMLSL